MTTAKIPATRPGLAVDRSSLLWDAVVAAAILVGFALLYHAIAHDYRGLAGYLNSNNVIFGADHLDALRGWVKSHKGTHPLLLLIVVPLGRLFELICGDWTTGLLAQTAILGAITVTAFFGLCRMLVGRLFAAAAACFFGVTMSQLTIGCVPDSFEFACLSTLPGYALMIVCLRRERTFFGLWVVAGLLTFGVTVPNFAQTVFCFSLVQLSQRSPVRALRQLVLLTAAVVLVTAVLSLLQRLIFPGAELFFVPGRYVRETQYLRSEILEVPGQVAEELFKNVLLYPVVGQDPIASADDPGEKVRLIYRLAPVSYGWPAFAAAALWLVLLCRGAILSFGDRATRPVTQAATLAVAANVVLHSFFGTVEIFLFSPHFLAALILVTISRRSMRGPAIAAAWCVLAMMTGFSNLATVKLYVDQYPDGTPAEIVPFGDRWWFQRGLEDPGPDWEQPGYDHSEWDMGRSGFGYGDRDDKTRLRSMRGRYSTLFTRIEFEMTDLDSLSAFLADVRYDDGFVIYLNGERVLSRNAPEEVTFESVATREHESKRPLRRRLPIETLVEGRNTMAVVGLNRSLDSSDFTLAVRLLRIDKPP